VFLSVVWCWQVRQGLRAPALHPVRAAIRCHQGSGDSVHTTSEAASSGSSSSSRPWRAVLLLSPQLSLELRRDHQHLGQLRVQWELRHGLAHLGVGDKRERGATGGRGQQGRGAQQGAAGADADSSRVPGPAGVASPGDPLQLAAGAAAGACSGGRQREAAAHLRHLAVVVDGAQVVEQLQGTHERLGRRGVHEVKVHLQRQAGST
jgi:hypothetical protein